MKTFAHVHANEVIQILQTEQPIAELFHPAMVWVDVTELVPSPAEGWSAQETSTGWQFAPPAAQGSGSGE